jgi:DNA-binding IclR family transcriptional regulator
MTNSRTSPSNTIQSVVRAFDVLRVFSPARPQLSISEIASLSGLSRSTVHRLIETLEVCGVVRRDTRQNKYMISAGILRFSNTFNHVNDVRLVSHPVMTALRDETGQTSAVHLREGWFRVTVAQAESSADLRVTYPDIGIPISLHLGAPGKAILAFLSPDERKEFYLNSTLERATDRSRIEPDALEQDVRQIQELGFALTRAERRVGVISIAAPLFNKECDVVGSINISGSVHRLDDERIASMIPMVVEAAHEVSSLLGADMSPKTQAR